MKNYELFVELFFSIHNKFKSFETEPRDFGTGDLLFSSEIHTIVAIGKRSGINLTELADRLNVSKSAVSKFTKKLLNKGYVIKSRFSDNQKEVKFNLSAKGKLAFKGHERLSKKLFKTLREILEDSDENEIIIFRKFLEKFNDGLSNIFLPFC